MTAQLKPKLPFSFANNESPVMQPCIPTPDYVTQFAEYFRQHDVHSMVYEDILWVEDRHVIFPHGPVSHDYMITREGVQSLLTQSRDGLLVLCTSGLNDTNVTGDWYAVICRRWESLADLSANTRSKVRRGLRNNDVRKVDAQCIVDLGYETHKCASARYGVTAKTEAYFKESMLVAADFANIIDFWGVFHEGSMVGYAQVHVFDDIEANYSAVVLHPGFFKVYTSYALVHAMNEYYLHDRAYSYVNDGFRSILHPTEFQELLINKFGFERVSVKLRIHYKPYLAVMMSAPKVFRRIVGRIDRRFAALNTLHEAAAEHHWA